MRREHDGRRSCVLSHDLHVGSLSADVDDGTGTGTPDGGVTIDDLLYFLSRFNAGC
ncbi:MAG: GC-type dockerin domain-anchored protein [Phycisphaerales bacterium]